MSAAVFSASRCHAIVVMQMAARSTRSRGVVGAGVVMRGLGVAVIGLVVLAGSAEGADLAGALPTKAPPPVAQVAYDWTGFYVGGNVGGHWGTDKITTTTEADFEGTGLAGGAAIDSASPATR